MRLNGYQINEEAKIVVLPKEGEKRSPKREREIKKLGYDLQNNLFKINIKIRIVKKETMQV